jgi:hypothetical protein
MVLVNSGHADDPSSSDGPEIMVQDIEMITRSTGTSLVSQELFIIDPQFKKI